MRDLPSLVTAAALTDEDGNLVGTGGMAHPAEVAPRQLAALIRIEGQLAETNRLLAVLVEQSAKAAKPKGG